MVFTLALLLGVSLGPPCHAANLRKLYPELAQRRASLDSLALVVDAVEVEDVFGSVEDVLIHNSRGYAEQALQLFGAELARKHYSIRRSAVLTLGALVDPAMPFRCPDKTNPAHTDASGFYVAAAADTTQRYAPFFADSSVLDDAGALAGWRNVLAAASTRRTGTGDSAVVVPAAIALGARLGCDALAIVSVQSHSVGMGKRLVKGVAVTAVGRVVGAAGQWALDPDFQAIGASIKFAIIDARDGRLLWVDGRTSPALSAESLKFRTPEMVVSLP